MGATDGKTARVVLKHRQEINDIRKKYPELLAHFDSFERELRTRLRRVHELIGKLDSDDQELVSTAVIHGIHRMTDEVFLCD